MKKKLKKQLLLIIIVLLYIIFKIKDFINKFKIKWRKNC